MFERLPHDASPVRSSVLAVINHVRHVRYDCEPMSTLNEIRDLCGHGVYSI